jgi:hypothetical protein
MLCLNLLFVFIEFKRDLNTEKCLLLRKYLKKEMMRRKKFYSAFKD